VTFGDDLTATLLDLRALAESAMLDTCTISPVTGVSDSTGAPTLGTAVYTGKCKIQSLDPQEANQEVGGATITVQRYAVHVPVGAFVAAVGQVVTITTAVLDAGLVGRKYRVAALLHKTLATAQRLTVEEVV
jgi:hypothetical protein